jgi:hypothetical protein
MLESNGIAACSRARFSEMNEVRNRDGNGAEFCDGN